MKRWRGWCMSHNLTAPTYHTNRKKYKYIQILFWISTNIHFIYQYVGDACVHSQSYCSYVSYKYMYVFVYKVRNNLCVQQWPNSFIRCIFLMDTIHFLLICFSFHFTFLSSLSLHRVLTRTGFWCEAAWFKSTFPSFQISAKEEAFYQGKFLRRMANGGGQIKPQNLAAVICGQPHGP